MSVTIANLDGVDVAFDDPNLVSDAGLFAVSTLVKRLGLLTLIDQTVRLAGRVGGANPASKLLTLVFTMIAGGSHIDHVDRLRAGDTARTLPFGVAAASTIGTFLRAFTFGHVRQLDRLADLTLKRVWTDMGAGPGHRRLVIDVDSTITEVFGYQKQGASYGYTGVKGYHPLVASRADTAEIVHARLRNGSSQKGHNQFIAEVVARVRRAGASSEILLRADSGFWSRQLVDTLTRLGCLYSITVSLNASIRNRIGQIPDTSWVPITYPDGGRAEVASTSYVTGRGQHRLKPVTVRLVVRRSRLTGNQAALFPNWRYHAFVTNQTTPVVTVDREHRHHAVVELAIRDLKDGAGASHMPSGHFSANGAWLAAAVLAHNLARWTQIIGDPNTSTPINTAATFRSRIVSIPGRLVNRAGQLILRLPTHWPWADRFRRILTNLGALPQLC